MPDLDEYAVMVKQSGDTFFAEVPDMPGCVAHGTSITEVWAEIENAKRLWVNSHGIPAPLFFKKTSKAVGRHW